MWTDRLAVGLDTLSLAVDRYAARVKTNLGNSSLQLDGILFLGEVLNASESQIYLKDMKF
jgi:hypothetical protein